MNDISVGSNNAHIEGGVGYDGSNQNGATSNTSSICIDFHLFVNRRWPSTNER